MGEIVVEMTGKEDRLTPWKIAIAGFGGAGKTMFASTAPSPLYVFFSDNPRIKSIANRHIPYVKLTNKLDVHSQLLISSAHEQLQMLGMNLLLTNSIKFETLVIDTGDELQQLMKEARRLKNGGEFGPGDWGWLADVYRETVTSLLDLPMNVIVLYHLKSAQEGDTGLMYRELMLQGAAKDEAPGWFDVVGALDTYEVTLDDGSSATKRVILTQSSRMYPWVKDHSGSLPRHFQLSDNFVGDYERMYELLVSDVAEVEHQVLGSLTTEEGGEVETGLAVPSPEELKATKESRSQKAAKVQTDSTEEAPEEPAPEPEPAPEGEPESEPSDEGLQDGPVSAAEVFEEEAEGEKPEPEPETEETSEEEGEGPSLSDEEIAEKEKMIVEELGGKLVYRCEECGEEIEDENVRELSQVRYRAYLCRKHYLERMRKK